MDLKDLFIPEEPTYVKGQDNHTLFYSSVAVGQSAGLTSRFPAENELFIDVDNEWIQIPKFVIEILAANGIAVVKMDVRPSKTLGHWHIVVTLSHRVDAATRIFLQYLMGSDKKRELYSLVRHILILNKSNAVKDEPVTLFFERG